MFQFISDMIFYDKKKKSTTVREHLFNFIEKLLKYLNNNKKK